MTSIDLLIGLLVAGLIFYDAYGKKRYRMGPSIVWSLFAFIIFLPTALLYLLFRPPRGQILEKGVAKIDPEFTERKYKVVNTLLMTVSLFFIGIILFQLGVVIPTFAEMFQEINKPLPSVTRILVGLGHYIWITGIVLITAIILFLKHPRMLKFHRKYAPISYVIYIVFLIPVFGVIIGTIVISIYSPLF